tara:strand:+ start:411 stop:1397 length:987 start_codon:yes stop_codon:yes gene_type:complete
MSIPPLIVTTARFGWNWQWNLLMNGLGPVDGQGNYTRPSSQHQKELVPSKENLLIRSKNQLPRLLIGRSCPWAHRTWIIHELRGLKNTLQLMIIRADHNEGRWVLERPWLSCKSLSDLYKKCEINKSNRATVPVIIDPGIEDHGQPKILGNESAQLIKVLNKWPVNHETIDLEPKTHQKEIQKWGNLLQHSVNNGVYKCGFARNQQAYDLASKELFNALAKIELSLSKNGPWLCGDKITLSDIQLFPTLIRWETVYMPLFSCSAIPLWKFPKIWEWRQNFMSIPAVEKTCDSLAWRKDYFGALFPLRPSGIIPAGPDLSEIVHSSIPK